MDFMALVETAAGAMVTLAAVAAAALIIVKSINCFKRWTNSDNKSIKTPATKFDFSTATSRNQDRESVEKEPNTSKELGEKEQGPRHDPGPEDRESHGQLGEKEHESCRELFGKEQESRDELDQEQDRQSP